MNKAALNGASEERKPDKHPYTANIGFNQNRSSASVFHAQNGLQWEANPGGKFKSFRMMDSGIIFEQKISKRNRHRIYFIRISFF